MIIIIVAFPDEISSVFLRNIGIKATFIEMDSFENEQIRRGEFYYVYLNPETLISNTFWREMLQAEVYKQNLVCLAFDEVHTAVSW